MSAEDTHCDTPLASSLDEGSDSIPEIAPSEESKSRCQSCRSSGLLWKALSISGALFAAVYFLRFHGAISAFGASPERAQMAWQTLSIEQAYEAPKYLKDEPFICGNKSVLNYLLHKLPDTVVLNAFDNNYVGQAQSFARRMDSLKAAYVGFCKEKECVEKFWAGCKGCRAHIVHCPNYLDWRAKEPYIYKSARCRGWRDIQYIKSYAFYDVVKAGKNVFMSDLDHDMRHIDFHDLLNRYKFADILVFMRDEASQFINFGFFFARNSAATASIANKLRHDVDNTWDQAVFNYQIADLENGKRLHCVELPYERFELRRLAEQKRCGLEHTHIDQTHHPRCWKPPK